MLWKTWSGLVRRARLGIIVAGRPFGCRKRRDLSDDFLGLVLARGFLAAADVGFVEQGANRLRLVGAGRLLHAVLLSAMVRSGDRISLV
jgi:hypothetical protein